MPRVRELSPSVLLALSRLVSAERGEAFRAQCGAVTSLSRLFTREREALTRDRGSQVADYLADETLRCGYLAYFLPVNLAKVQALLDELPALEEVAGAPRLPFRVLDLGSGPGTAAVAVLDWLRQDRSGFPRPLEVVAVDRSRPALVEAEQTWHAYLNLAGGLDARLLPVHADLERAGSLKHLTASGRALYDLIVMANTLNELFGTAHDPLTRRAKLVSTLLDLLAPQGSLVILEPALRGVSRDLHRVRDTLVAQQACTVYSPCLHERPCPALIHEDDWCHEERLWTPPPLVTAIDREVGFIKDALKFSYVILRKDARTIVPRSPGLYRVVSELREMKGEKRAWLCNETGRPEVGRLDRERSGSNAALDEWHRGAIVRVEDLVRKEGKDGQRVVARIPAAAKVEVVRPVGG
jgi:ribosomal protein RSM22 (predicted rRNA methylase)